MSANNDFLPLRGYYFEGDSHDNIFLLNDFCLKS